MKNKKILLNINYLRMGRTWDINPFPGYMVYQIPGTDTIPLLRVHQDPGTDSIQYTLDLPEPWDGYHSLLRVYCIQWDGYYPFWSGYTRTLGRKPPLAPGIW